MGYCRYYWIYTRLYWCNRNLTDRFSNQLLRWAIPVSVSCFIGTFNAVVFTYSFGVIYWPDRSCLGSLVGLFLIILAMLGLFVSLGQDCCPHNIWTEKIEPLFWWSVELPITGLGCDNSKGNPKQQGSSAQECGSGTSFWGLSGGPHWAYEN